MKAEVLCYIPATWVLNRQGAWSEYALVLVVPDTAEGPCSNTGSLAPDAYK